MSLWPSFRRDIAGFQPTNLNRIGYLTQHAAQTPSRLNVFGFLAESSSWPEGAFPAAPTRNAPITTGGMDAARAGLEVGATGNALAGGPVAGDAAVEWLQDGGLSLVIGLHGDATITVTSPDAELRLTIGMDGTATWTLTGDAANLAMIVPMGEASGSVTLSGSADLRGLLSMEGESTPFEELSPSSLARGILGAVVDGGLTVEQTLRVLLAVSAGKSSVTGSTVTFRDLGDTKNRIVATVSDGARSTVTVDAT